MCNGRRAAGRGFLLDGWAGSSSPVPARPGSEAVRVRRRSEVPGRTGAHAAALAVATSPGAVPARPALGGGWQPSAGSGHPGLRTPGAPRAGCRRQRSVLPAPVNLDGGRKMAPAGGRAASRRRLREPPASLRAGRLGR